MSDRRGAQLAGAALVVALLALGAWSLRSEPVSPGPAPKVRLAEPAAPRRVAPAARAEPVPSESDLPEGAIAISLADMRLAYEAMGEAMGTGVVECELPEGFEKATLAGLRDQRRTGPLSVIGYPRDPSGGGRVQGGPEALVYTWKGAYPGQRVPCALQPEERVIYEVPVTWELPGDAAETDALLDFLRLGGGNCPSHEMPLDLEILRGGHTVLTLEALRGSTCVARIGPTEVMVRDDAVTPASIHVEVPDSEAYLDRLREQNADLGSQLDNALDIEAALDDPDLTPGARAFIELAAEAEHEKKRQRDEEAERSRAEARKATEAFLEQARRDHPELFEPEQ